MAQTIPDSMQAVLLTGHGGFDKLEYRDDVPVPVPAEGQVLIRVAAAGINNTDINTRIGWYSKNVDGATGIPFTQLGCEFHPLGLTTGQRGRDGAFAQYTVTGSGEAYRVDSELGDAELASFPCAYSTAENMLHRAGVGQRERVFVTGASGGVGSAAVQLARRRGARVIASCSAAKFEQVRALGADEVVERGQNPLEVLGKDSIDIVVDLVAGPAWPALPDLLRPGGKYVTAGAIAGPIVKFDVRTLYLKDLTLYGCTYQDAQVFGNLVGYIERGEIKPLLSKVYPLSEIVVAQQDFLDKKFTGKLVLEIPA